MVSVPQPIVMSKAGCPSGSRRHGRLWSNPSILTLLGTDLYSSLARQYLDISILLSVTELTNMLKGRLKCLKRFWSRTLREGSGLRSFLSFAC